MVYDVAPKLRIMGTEFNTLDASKLELSFSPNLKAGKDYKLEIQSSTIIAMTLNKDKK